MKTSILEDMVFLYCQSYTLDILDAIIPNPLTSLKERCDDLKDLITDLRVTLPISMSYVTNASASWKNITCSERSGYSLHVPIGR